MQADVGVEADWLGVKEVVLEVGVAWVEAAAVGVTRTCRYTGLYVSMLLHCWHYQTGARRNYRSSVDCRSEDTNNKVGTSYISKAENRSRSYQRDRALLRPSHTPPVL